MKDTPKLVLYVSLFALVCTFAMGNPFHSSDEKIIESGKPRHRLVSREGIPLTRSYTESYRDTLKANAEGQLFAPTGKKPGDYVKLLVGQDGWMLSKPDGNPYYFPSEINEAGIKQLVSWYGQVIDSDEFPKDDRQRWKNFLSIYGDPKQPKIVITYCDT